MSQSSSAPGGSLPAVVGFFVIAFGAGITGITLVAILISVVWASLSHSAMRKVGWGALIFLPVALFVWSSIQAYLYSRPSAVAERQRVAAERAQLEAAAREKFEETSESLVGMWQNVAEPNYVIVIGYMGTAYRTDGAEIQYYDNWRLCYRSDDTVTYCESPVSFTDPSSALQLDIWAKRGIVAYEILQLDDSQLVTEHLFDSGNKSAIHKDSATQSFSRVTDAVTLQNFRPRRAVLMRRAQPDAETKIIDGVTHRFFQEPVTALTAKAWVASTPNQGLSKVATLPRGDSVELIAITDMKHPYGSFWFLIRYGDGLSGYVLGGNLCPKDVWTDGLLTPDQFERCVAP